MRKYGRTLPLTFRGMRMLTERGIQIAKKLRNEYNVLESHPRTIQKILGFSNLYEDLKNYFELPENISEHELDAALLTIAGIFYTKKEFMEFGDADEGTIILPKETTDLNDILSFKALY
jgi:predicted nuclease with RNAse H fold